MAQWISYKRIATALVCAGVALLVWLGNGTPVRRQGSLRVGYSTFVPYISVDDGGRPRGLAVDVLERAAERSGIVLKWQAVKDAEADARSGGTEVFPIPTITPDRRREFPFTTPWWESSQSLISLRRSPLREPADAAGKRIAVRALSYGPATAERALPHSVRIPIRDTRALLGMVCSGEADGALLEGLLMYELMLDMPEACFGQGLSSVPLAGTNV